MKFPEIYRLLLLTNTRKRKHYEAIHHRYNLSIDIFINLKGGGINNKHTSETFSVLLGDSATEPPQCYYSALRWEKG